MSTLDEINTTPSFEQLKQVIAGIERCHTFDSKAEFLRVWIRDWAEHKLLSAAEAQAELERIKALPPVAWRSRMGHCVTLNETIANDQTAPTWDGKPMWQPLYALGSKTA